MYSNILHKYKVIFISMVFSMLSVTALAQIDSLFSVQKYLQAGNYRMARVTVDKVVLDPSTSNNFLAWYFRGFTYKEVYKKEEIKNPKSPARDEAFKSLLKSLELDTAKEYEKENKSTIKYLAAMYFNDAGVALDSLETDLAIKNFDQYKKAMALIDPAFNLNQKQVEFDLALASTYTKIYETNRVQNKEYLPKIKEIYNGVLAKDPNNISANYNLGILYYNQAVNIIKETDYDMDLTALIDIQDNTVSLFKESLPFMQKAYELDPKRKETLISLSGIYFSLNEIEKSNEIKEKIDEIK
jgi:tetratricopeptide (TPR) repeat protein